MTAGDLVQALDYAGVFVFALSGALAAARSRLDPFGFVVIGIATGVGGGSIRDVLLDAGPVFWIVDPLYILVATSAALAGWFLAPKLESRLKTLIWLDAVGLALFAVLGAQKALLLGAAPAVAIVMGIISATFGGLLRDVICNELPLLLRKEIYALAALVGAGVFVLLTALAADPFAALAGGGAAGFAIRAAAIRFGLGLPEYSGLSRKPPDNRG